jgi:cytochrome c5
MLLVGFAFVVGCGRPAGEGSAARPDRAVGNVAKDEATPSAALSEDARARVERFCGDCHGMPTPESFPRERWPREVRQGYDFYLASLRTDLPRPPEGEAIRYFQDSAPERIAVPRAADRIEPPSSVDFVPIELLPGADAIDPAIAQVIAIPGREVGGATLGLLKLLAMVSSQPSEPPRPLHCRTKKTRPFIPFLLKPPGTKTLLKPMADGA